MFPERPRALLLPLVTLLAGCPRPPVSFGPHGEATDARELLARVELAELAVDAVKGEARLGVDAPQGRGSITLFAAAAHPAFMHLEQLDFFGRPQRVLVSDGARFGLFDAQDGRYYTGPATAANLSRFLPLPMEPAELVAVLLGRCPRLATAPGEGRFRFDQAQGVYRLTLARGAKTQALVVRPPEDRVESSTVTGAPGYDLLFSDVAAMGAASFPKRVRMSAASLKITLELTWKDVTLGGNDPTLFELTPPDGVPVVELDEHGAERAR